MTLKEANKMLFHSLKNENKTMFKELNRARSKNYLLKELV
jgi:hypothetical protein